MMQCGTCNHWVHAKCEDLTGNLYIFLSFEGKNTVAHGVKALYVLALQLSQLVKLFQLTYIMNCLLYSFEIHLHNL